MSKKTPAETARKAAREYAFLAMRMIDDLILNEGGAFVAGFKEARLRDGTKAEVLCWFGTGGRNFWQSGWHSQHFKDITAREAIDGVKEWLLNFTTVTEEEIDAAIAEISGQFDH